MSSSLPPRNVSDHKDSNDSRDGVPERDEEQGGSGARRESPRYGERNGTGNTAGVRICPALYVSATHSADMHSTTYANPLTLVTLYHVGQYAGIWDVTRTNGAAGGQLVEPTKLPFVSATQHFLSSIDPRGSTAVLGTPGGELGLLAAALAAVEATNGASLEEGAVATLFTNYLSVRTAIPSIPAGVNVAHPLRLCLGHLQQLDATGQPSMLMQTDRTTASKLAAIVGVTDVRRPATVQQAKQLANFSTRPSFVREPFGPLTPSSLEGGPLSSPDPGRYTAGGRPPPPRDTGVWRVRNSARTGGGAAWRLFPRVLHPWTCTS